MDERIQDVLYIMKSQKAEKGKRFLKKFIKQFRDQASSSNQHAQLNSVTCAYIFLFSFFQSKYMIRLRKINLILIVRLLLYSSMITHKSNKKIRHLYETFPKCYLYTHSPLRVSNSKKQFTKSSDCSILSTSHSFH